MPFVDTYDYSTTRKRTSDSYVKFNPDYKVVLRILDPKAQLVWKHWIAAANGGKGMMANCPNTSASANVCPIEKSLKGLSKEDPKYLDLRARKRYIVNVLDRTPYTICPACNTSTPKAKECINCGATLKSSLDFAPLNKVKILEGGPRIFATDLNAVEKMQKDDYPEQDPEITDYDITFHTQGTGRDRKIVAIPQAPTALDASAFIDPETQEEQKRFPLETLAEPSTSEEVELMVAGATLDEINAVRGVV